MGHEDEETDIVPCRGSLVAWDTMLVQLRRGVATRPATDVERSSLVAGRCERTGPPGCNSMLVLLVPRDLDRTLNWCNLF